MDNQEYMDAMTIRQYSITRNISFQSANQTFNRYKEELEGHYRKEGRTTILLPAAVELMDGFRSGRVHAVVENKTATELAAAREEIEKLRIEMERIKLAHDEEVRDLNLQIRTRDEEVKSLYRRIDDEKERYILLQASNNQLLLEDRQRRENNIFAKMRNLFTKGQ